VVDEARTAKRQPRTLRHHPRAEALFCAVGRDCSGAPSVLTRRSSISMDTKGRRSMKARSSYSPALFSDYAHALGLPDALSSFCGRAETGSRASDFFQESDRQAKHPTPDSEPNSAPQDIKAPCLLCLRMHHSSRRLPPCDEQLASIRESSLLLLRRALPGIRSAAVPLAGVARHAALVSDTPPLRASARPG
jgi:hypothetical protein